MERKDEIIELLKSLLGKLDKANDKCQFSTSVDAILTASNRCVEISKNIEAYVLEYEKIN